MLHELLNALEETLFMVFSAGLLTWLVGLPLGTILSVTGENNFLEKPIIYKPLNFIIKAAKSVPYIVIMIALFPLTRWLMGSAEGCVAAVIPLTLASIPHFAKLIEKSLNRVPSGLITTATAIGATPFQIIYKVLIPEALPNIIKGLTVTLTHLIGFSTIAGALGAGGLGSLIVHKGYLTFQTDYVLATVVMLVALVYIIQSCGDYIANGSVNHNSNA